MVMAGIWKECCRSIADRSGEAGGFLSAHAITTLPSLNANAVTAAAAKRAKCQALVTRNPADFKGSAVRLLTPSEALAWLASSRRGVTLRVEP